MDSISVDAGLLIVIIYVLNYHGSILFLVCHVRFSKIGMP
jgi:hypothetical protein